MRPRKSVPCALLLAILLAPLAGGQTYEVVGTNPLRNWGQPAGRLLAAADGSLTGATSNGGSFFFRGSLFALTPDGGGGFTADELHSFSGPDGSGPLTGLLRASDGLIYGATSGGGRTGAGTIFVVDASGRLTVLHDFADGGGSLPSELVEGPDGKLYGTTEYGGDFSLGALFRVAPSGTFEIVHSFGSSSAQGFRPQSGLVLGPDGRLWGTTAFGGASGPGTVYAVDASGTVSFVHSFNGTDGAQPNTTPVVDGGDLFGTTVAGGSASRGTVFRVTTAGVVTTLYSFAGTGDGVYPAHGLAVGSDGNLYGSTPYTVIDPPDPPIIFEPTLFRVVPAGGFATIHTFVGGNTPQGPLVSAADGNLYGSIQGSFSPEAGEIFRLATDGTVSTAFVFGTDLTPCCAISNLVEFPNGDLYGIFTGYTYNYGILRLDSSGDFSTFFTFDPGDFPNGDLLLGSDGNLYGMTPGDGHTSFGTVFRIDAGGTRTILHSFTGADGSQPEGGLAEGPGPEFFGATGGGGGNGLGTVFKIDANGTFTSLHDFADADGSYPYAGLARAGDGNFYGTTEAGGDHGFGTAYRIDSLGNFASIHSFAGALTEGASPEGALLPASDGNLYGTTNIGGSGFEGTIFRMDTAGNLTTIHNFDQPFFGEPAPTAPLLENTPGEFYGVALSFWPYGEVFRVDTAGTITPVHDFTGSADGFRPRAPLVKTADGTLYGSANGVFRLLPQAAVPTLSSLEPSSGCAAGGGSVIVHGHHFHGGVAATFGGLDATGIYFDRESRLVAIAPALPAGTLQDVTVTNADATSVTLPDAWLADFLDVPGSHLFHDFIEAIFRSGITAGCGGGAYCPNAPVTRAQMAVFLLKAEHGSAHTPPACQGTFADVPCPSLFADWIEELAAEGITAGCGGGNYCPTSPVRRDQMAVFLLKGEHGSSYVPPPCAGIFGDVTCPSTFANWIEQLAAESITGGCGGGNYCPGNANTRGQMAVFLVKTFGLQ